MRSKELRQQRAKLVEDARALVNKDTPTAEDSAKFDELMARADTLKAEIDRIERVESAEKELSERVELKAIAAGISPDQQREENALETAVFNKWLKGGYTALNGDEMQIAMRHRVNDPGIRAAQAVGTDSAGGYLVPEGFWNQLEESMLAYGGVREVSTVIRTASGNDLPMPTVNDTANKGAILTENTQISEQDVTFGSVTLNAYMYTSKLVRVSYQLMQDSAFDMAGFLAGALGTRIARITNEHFTTGTGTGQPKGVVTCASAGKTAAGGQTSSVIYDDLVDLEHSVDPSYRRGARFMMNDAWLKAIKKLQVSTTDERPIWLPGLAVKEPDTILGYPYTINQDMASGASASTKAILFGNFKKYMVRDVVGATLLRLNERYADYLQVGFFAYSRHDGDMLDAGTDPVKYFITAAS